MRIKKVIANNKKKVFEITVGKQVYEFPYSRLTLKPSDVDGIIKVYPDPEIGYNGFTYQLASNKENTIVMDQVLEYLKDPEYYRNMMLFKMTIEAQNRMKKLAVSKREITRRMGTTPTQFYRLMDQTNTHKTIDQMVKLLAALDCSVQIKFTDWAA